MSLALVASALVAQAATAEPMRVVSINLCTDQLAMLVAAPEQLISVSHLAFDPRGSAMADEAQAYVPNRGLAEEIYLMEPDLVVAGSFSARATVEMLKRLGVPVEIFDPASDLEAVSDRLIQMGEALGRQDVANALVAEYEARLAALAVTDDDRPSAVLYQANGYASGDQTLAGQILSAAGFENAAIEAGFTYGGFMPLEVLAMLDPDIVISGERYPGASRSEEILDHPVVESFREGKARGTITDRDWVCGTPYVLRAIEGLAQARTELVGE